ncbi:peptide ABC transporter permease [Pseudonocardia sulfidoxydans NBRC 16205]|uniref:Peptide ABC transporter permease n=1 Tax=Pseudonocardia sulfidoxydans NBRC 16205 TaxID=1223511 RepID=A0A511DJX4_9PSEU|nr:ABC transporter permease [Pseudonocardia sulfidoxydans]GEL25119.1 peptide ABC transporter permease [Pseudonocardia sulfidoxydans NBRC 16205]
MLRSVVASRTGTVSVAVLVFVALLAVAGPWLAPHDPLLQDPQAILAGASAEHWLGTDNLGRDVASRLLAGSTLSLVAALEAVAVGLVLGVVPALLSVHLGRAVEWLSLRLMEALVTLPFLVFAVAMTALLGNGLQQAMLAVGVLVAPGFYRVTRAAALPVATAQYVEAAVLAGASPWTVLRRHVWPKVVPAVAVSTASLLGASLVIVSSLTFLGIGITPPTPTWGGMLATDLQYLFQRPFGPFVPAVLIVATVWACNGIADALRDAPALSAERKVAAHVG